MSTTTALSLIPPPQVGPAVADRIGEMTLGDTKGDTALVAKMMAIKMDGNDIKSQWWTALNDHDDKREILQEHLALIYAAMYGNTANRHFSDHFLRSSPSRAPCSRLLQPPVTRFHPETRTPPDQTRPVHRALSLPPRPTQPRDVLCLVPMPIGSWWMPATRWSCPVHVSPRHTTPPCVCLVPMPIGS